MKHILIVFFILLALAEAQDTSNKNSLEHSSLGNHSVDFENFEGSQTSSLASLPKSSKNIESHTANIRMLGDSSTMESLESCLDSGVESLDSRLSKDFTKKNSNSLDSTQSVESNKINPHKTKLSATLKSVVGGGGKSINDSVREEKGERPSHLFAIARQEPKQNLKPLLALSQEFDIIEDSNLIVDSKGLKDFNIKSKLDSKDLKDSTLDSNTESIKDSSNLANFPLVSKDSTMESKPDSNKDILLVAQTQYNNNLESKNNNKTLTLEEIIKEAQANYPIYKNKQIADETLELQLTQLNMNYIPKLKLNGKASYQSDVTALPFSSDFLNTIGISSYQPLSKDQYNINVELSAPLLDTNIYAQKALSRAQSASKKAEIDNKIFSLKENIINIFFSILLLESSIEQNELNLKELHKNHAHILSLYQNGVISKDDVDKSNLEILKANKNKLQLESNIQNAKNALSTLSNINIFEYQLIAPNMEESLAYLNNNLAKDSTPALLNRPEIAYFTLKQEEIEQNKKIDFARSMPYIDAFFQGGYGNPALNILKPGFNAYYVAGVRLSWDFTPFWSKNKKDEIIMKNQLELNNAKEEFLINAKIKLEEYSNNAKNLIKILEQNKQLLQTYERVLNIQQKKLDNGSLSVNDFLSDVNKFHSIKLEDKYAQIQLLEQIFLLRKQLNEL